MSRRENGADECVKCCCRCCCLLVCRLSRHLPLGRKTRPDATTSSPHRSVARYRWLKLWKMLNKLFCLVATARRVPAERSLFTTRSLWLLPTRVVFFIILREKSTTMSSASSFSPLGRHHRCSEEKCFYGCCSAQQSEKLARVCQVSLTPWSRIFQALLWSFIHVFL